VLKKQPKLWTENAVEWTGLKLAYFMPDQCKTIIVLTPMFSAKPTRRRSRRKRKCRHPNYYSLVQGLGRAYQGINVERERK